jgi:Flp pilus assembly protein TadD
MRPSTRSISLLVITPVLGLCGMWACSPAPDEPLQITKGPYLQNMTRDGMTVMWETSRPSSGRVEYGEGNELTQRTPGGPSTTIHELRLSGLRAGARYVYRVESGGVVSATHSFSTAVAPGASFRFAFYGDNKDGPMNHRLVADAILATAPAFVIHNGDLVNTGWVPKQWDRLFFDPARRLMQSVPLYPVLGNHEMGAQLFLDYFSLPGNERWYSFDVGNAHFVVLESDLTRLAPGNEQLAWLERDLAVSEATWKFVNLHHPLFSASRDYHESARLERKNLLHPIFERHRVDMVFCGHDHVYERTRPIGSPGGHAVSYVVAGNGGTPLHWAARREWTAHSERVFGFVTVDVDGARAHLRALDLDGAVIDELVVDKTDGASYASPLASTLDFGAIEDPVEAARLWGEGDRLFDDGDFSSALPALMAAYEADRTTIRAVAEAATCLCELGRVDEAIAWALRGVEILPQSPEPYEALVDAYRRAGDDDAALRWAERWAAIEPDTPDARAAMAAIRLARGELEAATAELEKAVAILPSDAGLQFALGRLYEQSGDPHDAVAAYTRGLYWFMEEDDQDEEELQEELEVRGRVADILGR